jgi:hypothetical protein
MATIAQVAHDISEPLMLVFSLTAFTVISGTGIGVPQVRVGY